MKRKDNNITIGLVFGELKIIDVPWVQKSELRHKNGKFTYYKFVKCLCSCGKEKDIQTKSLLKGHTKSCGCMTSKLMSRPRKNNKSTQIHNNNKRCCKCLCFRPGDMFFSDKRNRDKLTVNCKNCIYFYTIKRKYGLSENEFNKLFMKNNKSCHICCKKLCLFGENNTVSPTIDHDHITNKVRGILCHRCNLSLHKEINIDHIDKMIKYIDIKEFKFKFKNIEQNYITLTKRRFHHAKYLYKCTESNINEMINFSKCSCYICKKSFTSTRDLCIDHNHKTGKVRGLLCNNCNCGISTFKESKKLLIKAKKYLQETSSIS